MKLEAYVVRHVEKGCFSRIFDFQDQVKTELFSSRYDAERVRAEMLNPEKWEIVWTTFTIL